MHGLAALCITVIAVVSIVLLGSCGYSSGSSGGGTTTNAYAAAYKKATFAGGVTVSCPSICAMNIAASGTPYQHQVYYLAPVTGGGTDPAGDMQVPYGMTNKRKRAHGR